MPSVNFDNPTKRKYAAEHYQMFLCREDARGVAGVAAATPFFEPEKIRNFVISFLRLIDSREKNPATPFLKS